MREQFDTYHSLLEDKLARLGLANGGPIQLGEKLNEFDSSVTARRWASNERSFLITRGCAKYPGGGRLWSDELLVEESENAAFAQELLIFAAYFHLTRRPLLPSDVMAIGQTISGNLGYSHVFVSVPFFLPGEVNVIRLEDCRFSLLWLMPIYPREAHFIDRHGTDIFEEKLKRSNYDYFDVRLDLGYLDE